MIKHFASRKAFTAAELLIVVAILAILSAIAAPNVAKYAKSIKLRELDDSARAIYMAAEHDFKSKIEAGKTLARDGVLGLPARYSGGESVTEMSYAVYRAEVAEGGVISVGAVEPELAANSWVIEFSAETGDIYGVFYSTDGAEFDGYSSEYDDEDGKYALAAERAASRVAGIGFYGLENAALTVPPKPAEIPKPSAKVINKEKLAIEISAPFAEGGGRIYTAVRLNGAVDIIPKNGKYYLAPGGKVTVILDAVGGEDSCNLTESLESAQLERSFGAWISGHESDFEPGGDVTVEVIFYDPEGVAIDRTETVRVNPLFADGSAAETAHIAYGRHLQNLENCGAVRTVIIDRTVDFKRSDPGDRYECWNDVYGYETHKFRAVMTSATDISARPGAQIRHLNAEGGGLFYSLNAANVEGLEIVNPKVTGDCAGAIAGFAYGDGDSLCTFKNCSVYVEAGEGESWDDPENDPYAKYCVSGGSSGGIVGMSTDSSFERCLSAVRVSGQYAGGLIGWGGGNTIEDCAVYGHTYDGKFEGELPDGTPFSLKDNVYGEISAGGIVGTLQIRQLTFKGTVYSACSVSGGENADVLVSDYEDVDFIIDGGATVYSAGAAYLPDGTELTSSAVADGSGKPLFRSAADFEESENPAYCRRYDMHGEAAPVYRYPALAGVSLCGDWRSAEPLSGFLYWENEGGSVRIHALYFDEKGKISEINSLADTRGVSVSAYGYAAFCAGGKAEAEFDRAISEDNFSGAEAVIFAIKEALAADGGLGAAAEKIDVRLYKADEAGLGTAAATVGKNVYTFAPDFYMLFASEKSAPTERAGTEEGVYGVRCGQHLKNVGVKANLGGKYLQSHDIFPGEVSPIGSGENPFTGEFDGGWYEISDMRIAVSDPGEPAGMFGTTDGARLKNIVIRAASEGMNYAAEASASPAHAPNESLASVDGEGYKADVTVGAFLDDVHGYVLLDGNEAKQFIDAFVKYADTDCQIRLNPTPGSSNDCHLYLMPEGFEIQVMDSFGSCYIPIDNITAGKIKSNPEQYSYISIQSPTGMYSEGKSVTVTIGNGYRAHWHSFDNTWTFDENKHWHECTDPNCEAVQPGFTSEHLFDGSGKCTECGYTKTHEHTWENRWDPKMHVCSVCGAREDHIFGDWQYFNNDSHQRVCQVCGYVAAGYHGHAGDSRKNNVTSHWSECDDCHYKMNYERHSFKEADGRQVCEKCGYTKPIPAALANNVLGGLVGEARSTVIEGCEVFGYALDPDSALASLLPGGAPALKFDDYHFSEGYQLLDRYEKGGENDYIILGVGMQTAESAAGGYSCEMERLITSAYNAIAAGHPEYEYRFRIAMKDGAYKQGSIGNVYFFSPDVGNRCAINPRGHEDTRKETVNGVEITYRVKTAEDIIYALEVEWANQSNGFVFTDYTRVGIYLEGETGYVQGEEASINTGENDQQPTTSNSVVGGIAAKTVAGTKVTDCRVIGIYIGDAAAAGGIVGEASGCEAGAAINGCKALVNGFGGAVNNNTKLGGILASKDGALELRNNKSAFRGLDVSWQYVYAVAPDADGTNKFVGSDMTAGFASGRHTGANPEFAEAVTLEEFDRE